MRGCLQEISVSSLYSGSDSREINVEFTPYLLSGNTYKLKIDLTLQGGGGKVSATAEFSNVTGSNTVTANYHADFFGNGLIISSQSNDMLMAAYDQSGGMTVQMENKNGHGIRVNNQGMMMKHHGGEWCYVPELVFSCNCNFSGTTMTPAGLYSFDNSSSSLLQVKRTRGRNHHGDISGKLGDQAGSGQFLIGPLEHSGSRTLFAGDRRVLLPDILRDDTEDLQ